MEDHPLVSVKGRVALIIVFRIQLTLNIGKCFSKPLEVYDFTFS